MVDVGDKAVSHRFARAGCSVKFNPDIFADVLEGNSKKGAVVEIARFAGIAAAKKTSELIVMCHAIALDAVDVKIAPCPSGEPLMIVECTATCHGKTGVEMEAMTGASVAALTLYDMTKCLDKSIVISDLRLLEKAGGKSGHFRAK